MAFELPSGHDEPRPKTQAPGYVRAPERASSVAPQFPVIGFGPNLNR